MSRVLGSVESGKPTRASVSLCNNADLISKVSEDTASKNADNNLTTPLSFDALVPGNPREYHHKH